MVKFISIIASLLGLTALSMACKRVDCCYSNTCPGDVLNDCKAKCCSATKREEWRNGFKGDFYFGVACAT
ncbi:hypothetical protein Slin15195_G091950 [Septoria linicola]|uniref:Uncharacterized protein n=1 Tax=Septoria linicola TaxID=215465 RepID=A0A9Q9ELK7_9PEZI|nr:hypothetical protein Slin15195_G091950 [Septoria linicola]